MSYPKKYFSLVQKSRRSKSAKGFIERVRLRLTYQHGKATNEACHGHTYAVSVPLSRVQHNRRLVSRVQRKRHVPGRQNLKTKIK